MRAGKGVVLSITLKDVGILEKIKGKTLNTSPGPAVGSIPGIANRVGKMMIPARKAIKESEKETHAADETRLTDLGK